MPRQGASGLIAEQAPLQLAAVKLQLQLVHPQHDGLTRQHSHPIIGRVDPDQIIGHIVT